MSTRRGRKPQPVALKLLRGNPGKRPLGPPDTNLQIAPLEPPALLTGEAREKWLQTAPELLAAGLLATIDRDALLAYCHAWARWRDAEAHLTKHGLVIAAPSGYPVQSPYLAISDRAVARMQALQTEFGMTPSSRSRVTRTPGKVETTVSKWAGSL